MLRFAFILGLVMIAGACDGAAQRRPNVEARDTEKPLSISGQVAGQTIAASGVGRCRHASEASIYDVPAALWLVEYSNPDNARLKQLNLTLWRPKDGSAEQLSLALETGSSSHRINVGGRGEQAGTGKASLSLAGPGGQFEIKGKDAKGIALEIVINCPAFAGVEAEGG